MIFDIEIIDPAAWEEYRRVAGPIMAAGGGEFIAASTRVLPLEGEWNPATLSVVRFPSFEAAETFYNSEAYQATLPLRRKAAKARGVLIDSSLPTSPAR